jgi:TRAP-type C4-dicarboxylate transport system substrate-binding protein
MRLRPTLTLLLIALLPLAGCGSNAPSKAGGPSRTVTLTAVTYTTNALAGETLARLVDEVPKSSGGAVTLKKGPAVDPGAQDGSADVIGMVRDGTVDVGIAASRTFDMEGATSLQALNAPMVVDSPAQAAAFLSDPATGPMLAGLDQAGVVGLALTYDQMRQPLGYDGPLDPRKLAGARVLARPSKASALVLAALGATADPRNGDDAASAIDDAKVVGAEASMDRPSGSQSGVDGHTSAITANVQLSIKANVVIVNPKVWAGLTKDQQNGLRSAATATRNWASHQVVTLSTSARAFCDRHLGDVVVAGTDQLTAWRQAVAPAVSALEQADPVTAAALERMRSVVAASPSTDVPQACTSTPADQLPSVGASGDQTVVAGEWRMLASAGKLATAGASQQDVGLNAGAWTFSLGRDGAFSYVEPRGRSCGGTFAVNGDRLSLLEDTSVGDCDGQWELTFRRDGDRMTWTPTPEFEATYPPLTGFLANPLELIGDPPR